MAARRTEFGLHAGRLKKRYWVRSQKEDHRRFVDTKSRILPGQSSPGLPVAPAGTLLNNPVIRQRPVFKLFLKLERFGLELSCQDSENDALQVLIAAIVEDASC